MKKLILFFVLLLGISTMQAQEVIQLDEARLNFNPDAVIVDADLNSFKCFVKENHVGEFSKNPIVFMKQNFDFKSFLSTVSNTDEFNEFVVTFNSNKGFLRAVYNKEGELMNTYQKFINKALPRDIRGQVYLQNKGWNMVSNKYVASGRSDKLDREVYKIKLENGKLSKKIKIVPSSAKIEGIVSN